MNTSSVQMLGHWGNKYGANNAIQRCCKYLKSQKTESIRKYSQSQKDDDLSP